MRPFALLCLVPSLTSALVAQVGYSTDFESFTASPGGTPCAGQDGFYVPAVAGSIDANVYTYAGNTLGVPVNPNGGANFQAGRAITGGPARAQRAITVTGACRMYIEFDVCCNYLGSAATPPNNIGSFSFQPSTTAVYVNLLARWPTGATTPPATWNADYVNGAGTQVLVPDPAFQNLPVNVWHTWGVTIDLGTGQHIDFRITNGSTNVTTVYTVPPGTDPLPGAALAVLPTDFRLFTGGADDVFAVDNLKITFGATYHTFGTGCAGTAGVPALAAAPGSLPIPGTTLSVQVTNLPIDLAIMATGFSNTLAAGSIPLPFSLAGAGFPGCDLLVDPVVNTFLVGSSGTATWTLALPANATFIGSQIYNQAISLDTGSPGLAFTNGAHACIGL